VGSWGHFAWSDLVSDRSRKPVGLQSPAACATHAGGDSNPNFESYDLVHAQSPDTRCGGHTRSWRANGCQALVSWVLSEGSLAGSACY